MRAFFRRLFSRSEEFSFSDDPSKIRLNLGCGTDYRQDWHNWDISPTVKADARLDFSKDPFPAADGFFDELYANGLLEQIEGNRNLLHFMNECHRVLKEDGRAVFVLPDAHYPIAFRDPNTARQFIPDSFQYFCGGKKRYEKYGRLYGYLPWKSYTASTDHRGIMTVVVVR